MVRISQVLKVIEEKKIIVKEVMLETCVYN